MTKSFISNRLRRYIAMASYNPYTPEDIEVLKRILSGYRQYEFRSGGLAGLYRVGSFGAGRDLCDAVWGMDGSMLIEDTEEDQIGMLEWFPKDRKLTFLQYLLVWHRKIFLFLCSNIRNVPMYVDTKYPLLKCFALWRMKINK